jgi:CRP-like cAMP-binding protein
VEALGAITIFSSLTDGERSVLESQLEYVPFTAGERMTRQGAVAHWLYVMTSGKAEVRRKHDDGTEVLLASLKAPEFFGEMGLMTGEPRIADVVATSDVECFRLRKEGFQKVLLNRPEIAKELSSRLAERRVELLAAAGRESTQKEEEERIFDGIRRFFGLETT